MSGRSVSEPHCSWASLPEKVYPYLVPILSPVTENLLFFKSAAEGNIPRKNVPDARVDLGTSGQATDRATAIGFRESMKIFLYRWFQKSNNLSLNGKIMCTKYW